MIGKVVRGQKVAGLLHYLFGPGRTNEHTDPRLVAAWEDPKSLEPSPQSSGKHELRPLTLSLEQPLHGAPKVPDKPVWHCAVRAAPQDRVLDDAEWARIARDVVARTGIAPANELDACRWVAVRHAADHIHIVATLARQDGRRVALSHDYYRVGDACRDAEERLGLRRTGARDRTAARRPTRGELEKAHRRGANEPPRTHLRRIVQLAAAGNGDTAGFFDALRAEGLLVRERRSDRDPTQVTGYAVALPCDLTADGSPVWFSGSKLAPDLSWARLQKHWSSLSPRAGQAAAPGTSPWRSAERAVTAADALLRSASASAAVQSSGSTTGAGSRDLDAVITASGDLTVVLAGAVHGRRSQRAAAAIDDASRATRLPFARAAPQTPLSAGLRIAACQLSQLSRMGRPRKGDRGAVIDLLTATARLIEVIAELQRAQNRLEQARAGHRAANHLRITATALDVRPAAPRSPVLGAPYPRPLHQPRRAHPGRHR